MHKLGKSLQSYYLQGLAKSTQRTYTSAKSRFIAFCTQACTSPLPLSESVLCFYVSHLADEGLAHTTIKSYLSACRHLHISHGYFEPCIGDMPRLAQVMKGIKASQAKQGRQAKPRLPITPSILTQIKYLFLTKNLRTSTTSWHGLRIQHASLASCVQERSASPPTVSMTQGHT